MPEEAITQDEFLQAFGATAQDAPPPEDTTPTEPDNPENNEEEPEDNNDNNDEGDSSSETNNQDEPESDNSSNEKANAVFAQMRVENKRKDDLLKNIATVLGVQSTDNSEELLAQLQEKVVAAQAKQQNIPVELAKRMAQLEQNDAAYQEEQLRRTALLGFQKVKDTFGLENKDLEAFAAQLDQAGISPFSEPVNLVSEYKIRNFEKLIKTAEERGAKLEAERAAKAKDHSSQPNNKNGKKTPAGTEKINTESELTKYLSQN